MNFLHSIGAGIAVVGIFLGSLFGYSPAIEAPTIQDQGVTLGTALPSATANFESSLATGITDIATSLTLTSVLVRGGGTLSGYVCLTIDEGSAQAEFVCGTASSTSVTGLTRGISPADGITEDADLKFSHRRGASVKITDFPLIQRIKAQNAGEGTYEAVLSYAPGVTPSGGSELVDVEYITSVITGTSTLSYNKIVVNSTAGETVSTGTAVYLKPSDQRWWKLDVDDLTHFVDREIGVSQGAATAGNSIPSGVLTYGLDSTQKNLTPGNYLYASSTAGATTTTATAQVIGVAISATTMFVNQDLIDGLRPASTTFTNTVQFSSTTQFNGNITTNGTATSTFAIASSSSFTSTFTWTRPVGIKQLIVEVIGGGATGGTDTNGGGGGGGGAYCKAVLNATSLPTSATVTVGAASAASSFGSLVIAGAGTAGSSGTGGAGGDCSGSITQMVKVENFDGETATSDTGPTPDIANAGDGGDNVYGKGGRGAVSGTGGGSGNMAGSAGTGYGSGGGGSITAAGAFGKQGFVTLTEIFN